MHNTNGNIRFAIWTNSFVRQFSSCCLHHPVAELLELSVYLHDKNINDSSDFLGHLLPCFLQHGTALLLLGQF